MDNHGNNFFILTGGPGAGKTSVLEVLAARGYATVAEVARQIIKEQIRIGGDGLHTGDKAKFCDLMLSRSLLTWDQAAELKGPVFFDRGLPDLVGYGPHTGIATPDYVMQAARLHRYNNTVFVFPPWQDIYCHDEERKQNFDEAIRTFEVTVSVYGACGYTCVEMPKTSIDRRAAFILSYVQSD